MVGGKNGGTIYQWALGWHVSAHQVAKKRGHEEIFKLLMERSPSGLKLITACWLGDEAMVHSSRAGDIQFSALEQRQVAHAARNNDTTALKMMLRAGLPITARGQHNATPLHWAAWHGNAEMVAEILRHHPPLEDKENEFGATPLGWAIHGSEHGWHRRTGDFRRAVEQLLKAGAKPPDEIRGSEAVKRALRAG